MTKIIHLRDDETIIVDENAKLVYGEDSNVIFLNDSEGNEKFIFFILDGMYETLVSTLTTFLANSETDLYLNDLIGKYSGGNS
ncbi:MAG: hypothetical protein H6Q73_3372 [Firmicutes bacterium]|nr:hypothetical protein [Bacillota bacterium]